MIDPIKHRRTDRQAIVAVLESAGAEFRGNACRCPFHEDRHSSAGIYQDPAGVWRFKCQAASCAVGGDVFDLQARLENRPVADVLREAKQDGRPQRRQQSTAGPKPFANLDALWAAMPGRVEGEYFYSDPATGTVDLIVFRCRTDEGKTFRQARPDGAGYILQAPPKPWPLYNRGRVARAETIIVCEGEKDVHTLHDFGIVGTTSPAGALNAENADWTGLAGKNAVLWPDADEAGERYADTVERILAGLDPAPRVARIDPAGLDLEGGDDVSDFVEQLRAAGQSESEIRAELLSAIQGAKPRTVLAGLHERFEAIVAGRYKAVELPWAGVHRFARPLLPGTITLIVGGVGASKSFALLQLLTHCQRAGISAACYMLEEGPEFHLQRAAAQLAGLPGLTDPEWISENPEQAQAALRRHEAELERLARAISTAETQPTLPQLADWIEQRARTCRVVAADPVTAAAHTRRDSWAEDAAFLQRVQRAVERHGASAVLITHPTKSVSCPDINSLAGSAAYSRFSQSALWLQAHDWKPAKVRTACGTVEAEHNRTLHVLKARNGQGTGLRLAAEFDSETLTLRELGVIVGKAE